jgi:hypothetical protein
MRRSPRQRQTRLRPHPEGRRHYRREARQRHAVRHPRR